jgi:cytosolic carboxypeptidase protein 5
MATTEYPAHNVFEIDGVTFSSNFDNGNLLSVEKTGRKTHEYQIWAASDNHGSPQQSRHCTWFYFTVSGLPQGCTIKIVSINLMFQSC